jgi:osmoprotectant transport system permease protein
MSLVADTWQAFQDNDGWEQTVVYIKLSGAALGIAVGIGVSLGVLCAKIGKVAAFFVTAVANLGRTVPEFAIMALAVALSSIGFWPAVVGLVALGVPPILLNVYTGLREVDSSTVGAARGMGMTPTQILARIEVPLAAPLAFAGIRVASVQIVATAALAGLVGAGGLGVLVLSGLTNSQDDVLLAGAIPIAILAMAAQALFATMQRVATPRGIRLQQRNTSPTKGTP